jgi:N6-adenosine-specific RNA methylase IME4
MPYKTILIDPPWPQRTMGRYRYHSRPDAIPYKTMTVEEIAALPVASLADQDECHLWLWTTNQHLPQAFGLLDAWGFKYLSPLVWVKPSGMGSYFVSRTQFLIFGYRGTLAMRQRFKPNVFFANALRHSQKPECSYQLIEEVSYEPRIELFARKTRPNWTCLGDGIDGRDINDALLDYILS